MSIQDLISLAHEFEQAVQDDATMIVAPNSMVKSIKPKEDVPPETQPEKDQFPSFEMNMDFNEVVNSVHRHVSSLASKGTHIGQIKKQDYAGHSFSIVGQTPSNAFHLFREMVKFIKTKYSNSKTNYSSNVRPMKSYSPNPGSGTDTIWAEFRYPDEDALITIIQRGTGATFKITTIEQ